jgi:hypothetical protein
LLQWDKRKTHGGLTMTTMRDNNKDPHLRHPMVEQLGQLWRNKTAWGDFMKRGCAAQKRWVQAGRLLQLDN